MIKNALIGFALTFSTFVTPAFTGTIQDDIMKASVLIDQNCSGTIFDVKKNEDGTQNFSVLTAAHCTQAKTGESHTVNIPVVSGNILYGYVPVNSKLDVVQAPDVAVLKVEGARLSFELFPAKIGTFDDDARLYNGMPVYCFTFGAARSPVLNTGFLGYKEDIPQFGGLMQRTSCPAMPGSSGGGLFIDDGEGGYELIGTVTGGWSESFNIFSPLTAVAKAVADSRA